MNKTKIGLVLTVLLCFLSIGFKSAKAATLTSLSRTSTPRFALGLSGVTSIDAIQTTNVALDQWVKKMAYCESTNNPLAVNPVDLDGTPSLGLYQFKPGTFRHYVEKYNLFGWQTWTAKSWLTAIWNGDYQETVFRRMLTDDEVDLHHEFPWCTRRLGLPPASTADQLTLNLN